MALHDSLFAFIPPFFSALRFLFGALSSFRVLLLSLFMTAGFAMASSNFGGKLWLLVMPHCKFWGTIYSVHFCICRSGLDDVLSLRVVVLIFLITLNLVDATCTSCHGAVEGCDGTSCPWLTGVADNVGALAATTLAVSTCLNLQKLLPDGLLRAFPRQALDSLLTLSKLPSRGVPIDLSSASLDIPMLKLYWSAGRISRSEVSRAMDVIMERVYSATGDAAELARTKFQMMVKSLEIAMKEEPSSPDVEGGYRHYVLSRISHFVNKVDATSAMRAITDRSSTGVLSGSNLVGVLIFPSPDLADLVIPQMVHYFCLFMHALGFENILGLGVFVNHVVFDTVLKLGYTYMFALELLLVYLKALDASSTLELTTIWEGGSQDTYLNKAKSEFKRRWGDRSMFFRTHGGNPSGASPIVDESSSLNTPGAGWTKPRKWNGKFNQDSDAKPCVFYNLHKEHPAKVLLEDGTCKFPHICDHFVTNKGSGGRCCSKNHTRDKCDNTAKGPKQQ